MDQNRPQRANGGGFSHVTTRSGKEAQGAWQDVQRAEGKGIYRWEIASQGGPSRYTWKHPKKKDVHLLSIPITREWETSAHADVSEDLSHPLTSTPSSYLSPCEGRHVGTWRWGREKGGLLSARNRAKGARREVFPWNKVQNCNYNVKNKAFELLFL